MVDGTFIFNLVLIFLLFCIEMAGCYNVICQYSRGCNDIGVYACCFAIMSYFGYMLYERIMVIL